MRDKEDEDDDTQVYKKPWVGLTDIEILDTAKANSIYGSDNHYEVMEFVASVEEKLRRKNT